MQVSPSYQSSIIVTTAAELWAAVLELGILAGAGAQIKNQISLNHGNIKDSEIH